MQSDCSDLLNFVELIIPTADANNIHDLGNGISSNSKKSRYSRAVSMSSAGLSITMSYGENKHVISYQNLVSGSQIVSISPPTPPAYNLEEVIGL